MNEVDIISKEPTVKSTLVLPKALYDELKIAIIRRGVGEMQTALAQAVRMWLDANYRKQESSEFRQHSPESVPQNIALVLERVIQSLRRIEDRVSQIAQGMSQDGESAETGSPSEPATGSAEAEVSRVLEEIEDLGRGEKSNKAPRKRGGDRTG